MKAVLIGVIEDAPTGTRRRRVVYRNEKGWGSKTFPVPLHPPVNKGQLRKWIGFNAGIPPGQVEIPERIGHIIPGS